MNDFKPGSKVIRIDNSYIDNTIKIHTIYTVENITADDRNIRINGNWYSSCHFKKATIDSQITDVATFTPTFKIGDVVLYKIYKTANSSIYRVIEPSYINYNAKEMVPCFPGSGATINFPVDSLIRWQPKFMSGEKIVSKHGVYLNTHAVSKITTDMYGQYCETVEVCFAIQDPLKHSFTVDVKYYDKVTETTEKPVFIPKIKKGDWLLAKKDNITFITNEDSSITIFAGGKECISYKGKYYFVDDLAKVTQMTTEDF